MPIPCGSRPSMAALTSSGARNAREIVILTLRTLRFSRFAMVGVANGVRERSKLLNAALFSDRIGRMWKQAFRPRCFARRLAGRRSRGAGYRERHGYAQLRGGELRRDPPRRAWPQEPSLRRLRWWRRPLGHRLLTRRHRKAQRRRTVCLPERRPRAHDLRSPYEPAR